MDSRITEQPSHYNHLERMSVGEIITAINHESATVAGVIQQELPQIETLITAIERKLRNGGRLFYCGCGTGGRLCVLDTIEVQNTYMSPPEMIQAIFPRWHQRYYQHERVERRQLGRWLAAAASQTDFEE